MYYQLYKIFVDSRLLNDITKIEQAPFLQVPNDIQQNVCKNILRTNSLWIQVAREETRPK
jgi:hypothetical protein